MSEFKTGKWIYPRPYFYTQVHHSDGRADSFVYTLMKEEDWNKIVATLPEGPENENAKEAQENEKA